MTDDDIIRSLTAGKHYRLSSFEPAVIERAERVNYR
jgi:hypothetical protein